MIRQDKGSVLLISILAALVSSIISYAVLFIATSQARQGRFQRERARVRYATEAAVVWAQQRLWQDPTWPGAACPSTSVNIGGYSVTLNITNCGNPNASHQIQAQVLGY